MDVEMTTAEDEVARTTSLSTAYELDRAVVVKVVTIALAQEVNNPLLIGKLLAQSVCAKYPDSPMARTFRKDKRMAPNVLDLFGLARVGTITATQADDRAVSRVTRCTQHAASSPVVFVSVFFEAVREMLETVNDATARDNCVAMLPDTLRRNSQEYFYTELLQAQASLPAHYTSRDDPTEYVNALRTWAAAVADAARERVAQHQRLDVAGQRTNPAARPVAASSSILETYGDSPWLFKKAYAITKCPTGPGCTRSFQFFPAPTRENVGFLACSWRLISFIRP